MSRSDIHLVKSESLSYLVSVPGGEPPATGVWPVLCFLHGYDEGPPTHIREALTRHGPLRPGSSSCATDDFLVIAPQMPTRGDFWHRYADAVEEIVLQVQSSHGGDQGRRYLTGFSYGGNGVFDLALAQPNLWTALWAVEPTRVPEEDPGCPIWLSSGEASRRRKDAFMNRLRLAMKDDDQEDGPGDRVYEDRGEDHAGTATLAYEDDAVYRWLLGYRGRRNV